MTGREKILASINHKETPSIAKDLGATPSSGISALAYNNLIEHTGWKLENAKVYDVVQQLAQVDDFVLDKFNIDVVDIGRAFNEKPSDWKSADLYEKSPVSVPAWFEYEKKSDGFSVYKNGTRIAHMPDGATFFDGTYVPYPDEIPEDLSDLDDAMGMILWQNLAHSPWDHSGEEDFWKQLRERTLKLRQTTDRALMVVCGCNMFEWGTFLRRIDEYLCDIIVDPEGIIRLNEALFERHIKTLEKVCDAVGDVADILRFGDDLGLDTGPFMNPVKYRELFKPYHTKLNDYVHKNSSMKTFLHSCGSIYRLMPDLIEAGYDIINPVQTSATDMHPDKLKKEFGADITFWGGGCDTRSVLNRGTAAEVKDHVKRMIDILAPGGGFVFNTIHNIMPDVPPQNITAMFEAVNDYQ